MIVMNKFGRPLFEIIIEYKLILFGIHLLTA